jgi:hypothetical protein
MQEKMNMSDVVCVLDEMHEGVLGNGGIAASIFYVDIRREWQLYPALLPVGKPTVHYWIRGCVFLIADVGSVAGREKYVPAGTEPRFVYGVASNVGLVASRPCNSGNRDNEV